MTNPKRVILRHYFVLTHLSERGFHPRLGARPLRDAIEKYLRGAVADATPAQISARSMEFVVSGNCLLLRACPLAK